MDEKPNNESNETSNQSEPLPQEKEQEKKPDRKKLWGRNIARLDCIQAIDEMLWAGVGMADIVRYIKHTAKEMVDSKDEAIRRQLYHYKNYLAPQKPSDLPDIPLGRLATKTPSGEKIDVLAEMEWLYKKQKERVQIDIRTEKSIKKLFSSTHREMAILQRQLESIGDLQRELGLLRHNMPDNSIIEENQDDDESDDLDEKQMIEFKDRFGDPKIKKVLSNPEGRQKVLSALDLIVQTKIEQNYDQLPEENDDNYKEVNGSEK